MYLSSYMYYIGQIEADEKEAIQKQCRVSFCNTHHSIFIQSNYHIHSSIMVFVDEGYFIEYDPQQK